MKPEIDGIHSTPAIHVAPSPRTFNMAMTTRNMMRDVLIARDFLVVKGNTIHKIIETALNGNFGTIVVGRREIINFTQEHFRGRFSGKIIKTLDNIAVWVVS